MQLDIETIARLSGWGNPKDIVREDNGTTAAYWYPSGCIASFRESHGWWAIALNDGSVMCEVSSDDPALSVTCVSDAADGIHCPAAGAVWPSMLEWLRLLILDGGSSRGNGRGDALGETIEQIFLDSYSGYARPLTEPGEDGTM